MVEAVLLLSVGWMYPSYRVAAILTASSLPALEADVTTTRLCEILGSCFTSSALISMGSECASWLRPLGPATPSCWLRPAIPLCPPLFITKNDFKLYIFNWRNMMDNLVWPQIMIIKIILHIGTFKLLAEKFEQFVGTKNLDTVWTN